MHINASTRSAAKAGALIQEYLILQDHSYLKNEKSGKNSLLDHKEVSKSMILLPTRDTHITLDLHKVSAQEEPKFLDDAKNTTKNNMIMKATDNIFHNFNNERGNSVENLSNDFSFQCNTRDIWQSDSSQNIDSSQSEIRDVDSSISALTPDSGSNSSHELHSSRSILVKPLTEPEDDTSSYIRWQKETPIEREIRLAREREEELRRDKGLPPLAANNVVSNVKKAEVQKFTNRRNTALNDCRSVQHRIATSRIQQEINEATEREKELHAAGLIQTISEDTVDSKVTRFTDLAGYAIEETERKLRRAVSTSSVATEPENQPVVSITPQNGQKATTFRPLFESTPNYTNSNTLTSSKKLPPRVGHKGVMQRFLASRGKVSPVTTYSRPNLFSSVSYSAAVSPLITSKDMGQKIDAADEQEVRIIEDKTKLASPLVLILAPSGPDTLQVHNFGYAINTAFWLPTCNMKETWPGSLQRARIFAQSHPNLLSIGDFEESDVNHESEEMKRSSISGNSDSSSFLENSKDTNGDSSLPEVV
ncbi:Uncharacterized protein GBIM_16920 [Gryllus bimaculatus]|nr:Uncharacterized protein GBIM_16920 [Gryllus bimaculatus]